MAAKLPRALGFWMCLALVVGNMIGSGVFLLPASLAPYGWNALFGWFITIAGALCLAFVFARLSAVLPKAGGPYAYADAAFGPTIGFIVAWSYWVMLWSGNGAIAVAVVSSIGLLMPQIGATPGLPALLAVALVWGVTAINIYGVAAAGRVQVVTTLLKLLPMAAVVIVAAIILSDDGAAAVAPWQPGQIGVGAVAATAALTFWGFLGLESATVPAGQVEDAARTIPRATLWGTAFTGLVYVLVCSAVTLLMPADTAAKSPAPIAEFVGLRWGAGAADVIALFAAISAFGTLNGFVLVQGEVPWAMARGGVFPAWLAKSSRRGTPARAHIVSSLLLTIVTLMNYSRAMTDLFAFIALVSIAAGLIAYLVSALAAIKLLPNDGMVRVIAPLAGVFTLWTLYGCGLEAVAWGGVLLLAGIPIYLAVRRTRFATPA
ncbi:amino acid/polyamine/organocation transporter, APC superfamily [Sphingomonas laterariae]|uniref:Arginine/agmatine antiporter n=1 Tax=Edaphosphingomonas laterariae TaxID=861865 RepID=A0A239BI20_9SPHN|nr:amino acid permease [Sphingomonas laterariae]SNS06764.1 amino acid/polyamine/organocation transporter, APC superfamily [Sphingomonas laterariae]